MTILDGIRGSGGDKERPEYAVHFLPRLLENSRTVAGSFRKFVEDLRLGDAYYDRYSASGERSLAGSRRVFLARLRRRGIRRRLLKVVRSLGLHHRHEYCFFQRFFFLNAAPSFDKQLHLSELVGEEDWHFDMTSRSLLSFGDRYAWRVQLLGTESEETQTWLWAWANEVSKIPPPLLQAALQLKAFGEEQQIPELATPMFPLEGIDGHFLAMIASGVCHANGYYRCPYDGGAAFLLIQDENFPKNTETPLQRIASVFPQAIASIDIPNHRDALAGYLEHYGLVGEAEDDMLVVREDGEAVLTAVFDVIERLAKLEVSQAGCIGHAMTCKASRRLASTAPRGPFWCCPRGSRAGLLFCSRLVHRLHHGGLPHVHFCPSGASCRAERIGARGIPWPPTISDDLQGAYGKSECHPHTVEVTGSNPVPPIGPGAIRIASGPLFWFEPGGPPEARKRPTAPRTAPRCSGSIVAPVIRPESAGSELGMRIARGSAGLIQSTWPARLRSAASCNVFWLPVRESRGRRVRSPTGGTH